MENLSNLSDTAILNALFAIAAVEANGDGLSEQDEQDYSKLEVELSNRRHHGRRDK